MLAPDTADSYSLRPACYAILISSYALNCYIIDLHKFELLSKQD